MGGKLIKILQITIHIYMAIMPKQSSCLENTGSVGKLPFVLENISPKRRPLYVVVYMSGPFVRFVGLVGSGRDVSD